MMFSCDVQDPPKSSSHFTYHIHRQPIRSRIPIPIHISRQYNTPKHNTTTVNTRIDNSKSFHSSPQCLPSPPFPPYTPPLTFQSKQSLCPSIETPYPSRDSRISQRAAIIPTKHNKRTPMPPKNLSPPSGSPKIPSTAPP